MTHQHNASDRSVLMHVTIYGLLVAFMATIFFGCDQAQQLITPGTPSSVKLGLLLDENQFISTRYGAQLALSEVNQQSGLFGIPIELVIRDTTGRPNRAEQLAEQLITQHNVVAILGPNTAEEAMRVGNVAQQHRVPMLATTPTAPHVTDAGEFVFMTTFTDSYQAQVMAGFARQTLNAVKAAILTQTSNPHSEELSALFATDFTALGGQVVARENYAAGDTDFTAQLTRITDEAPDVIFVPGSAPEVPLIVQQARRTPQPNASGITAKFLGSNRWDTPAVFNQPVMRDNFYSGVFAAEFPKAIQKHPNAIFTESETHFISAYTDMFGIKPDGAAALGYDAVRLVVTAMRRAGEAKAATIRDQIAATRNYRGATTILEFDENRRPTKNAIVLHIGDEPHFQQRFEP